MKLVVLDGYLVGTGGCSWEPLSQHGDLLYYDETSGEDDVAARIGDADAAFTNRCPITAETIRRCPKLKLIHSFGTGFNQIDLAAAQERGIVVCNTPGYGRGAVAQMAVALMFAIARNVSTFDHYLKTVGWTDRSDPKLCAIRQMELTGKTLGIIGMGDIGCEIAIRAQASKMKVIYHNRRQREDDEKRQVRYVSQEELLAQADFVMLAVNLNPSTKHLMNAAAFAQMKPGACLINISRGAVVDTEAMYEALKSGRLAYAAMDVTDPEPLPGEHKLLTLPNVTVTPHMASATAETRDAMAMLTVENIVAALEGRAMPAEVKTK